MHLKGLTCIVSIGYLTPGGAETSKTDVSVVLGLRKVRSDILLAMDEVKDIKERVLVDGEPPARLEVRSIPVPPLSAPLWWNESTPCIAGLHADWGLLGWFWSVHVCTRCWSLSPKGGCWDGGQVGTGGKTDSWATVGAGCWAGGRVGTTGKFVSEVIVRDGCGGIASSSGLSPFATSTAFCS